VRRPVAALTLVSAFLLFQAASLRANTERCGEKQDQWLHHADPKTWASLYRLFRQFSQCDDGEIAEGFSKHVAQLLLNQWTHLTSLDHLMTSDAAFGEFVLRHIDATLSEDELKAIAANTRDHCPTGEGQLCRRIGIEADRSLNELRR